MGRARAVLQSEFPYNIGGRCINREWFTLEMDLVWKVFSEELHMAVVLHDLRIHSFVLMSNHFHLIASTPKANLSQCMHRLLGTVSRRLNSCGNRINETFAGRHFKTVLQHPNYFLNAYKYNYRNPVRAGICNKVEDYPFSSLYGLLGRGPILFPLAEDFTLFTDVESCLQWLNEPPPADKSEAVRFALKRQFFQPKKCRKSRKPLLNQDEHI